MKIEKSSRSNMEQEGFLVSFVTGFLGKATAFRHGAGQCFYV